MKQSAPGLPDPLEGYKIKVDIQPRFSDVDGFGHVNNAVFFTYFEEARVAYVVKLNIFRPLGTSVRFVIQQAECTYLLPLTQADPVQVYVRTADWGEKSFMFEYALWMPEKQRLAATGMTRAVAYDLKARRSAPIPEEFLKKMKSFEGAL